MQNSKKIEQAIQALSEIDIKGKYSPLLAGVLGILQDVKNDLIVNEAVEQSETDGKDEY